MEKYNYPAYYSPSDPRRYVPTGRYLKKIFGWLLIIIIIAAIVYLVAIAYFWATSPTGERTLSDISAQVSDYLPWNWYLKQLERAQTIGKGGWSAQPNLTESGLVFEGFEVIGTKQIPQGAAIILKYKTEVKNFEEEIKPDFKCYVKDYNINGKIIPASPVLSRKIGGNVRCTIEDTANLSGTVNIVGNIIFPFKTENVLLDVYFTTEKVVRNIEGDFFDYFDIDIKQPIRSAYNGEPVEVAIGVSDTEAQPVVLEEGINPLVGISLTNKWKGRIRNLTDLRIYLPAPITINEELSKSPSIICPFEGAGNEKGYNVYSISSLYRDKISFEEEKDQKVNFECWLNVNPSMVRGNYEHKKYKVDAGYIYELKEREEAVTIVGEENE